jgi:hypothetical protein
MASAISYRIRGAGTGSTVTATVSDIETETINTAGFPETALVRDFICRAADFATDPAVGDIATFGGRNYEVIAFNEDEAWRYTDASNIDIRIHTKDIGAVT